MQRTKKTLLFSLGGLVLVGLVFLCSLPALFSTRWGKRQLIGYLEKRLEATITIDRLSLSWFSGQQLEKVIVNKEEAFQFQLTRLETECSFWNLVWRRGTIGQTSLVEPRLTVQAAVNQQARSRRSAWSHFRGAVDIQQGTLTLDQEGQAPLNLQVAELKVATDPNAIAISGRGTTAMGTQTGDFTLKLNQQRSAWRGMATITSFPIDALRTLIAPFLPEIPALILQSFGQTLDLSLTAEPEVSVTLLDLNLTTPGLTTTLACRYDQSKLIFTRPARLEWTLTPALFQALTHRFSAPVQLKNPATLACTIAAAQIELAAKKQRQFFDCRATVSAGRTNLTVAGDPIAVELFVVSVETTAATNTAQLTLSSQFRDGSLPKASFRAAVNIANGWGKKRRFTELSATLQNGPVPLIDRWRSSNPPLAPWLGSTVDLELSWQKTGLEIAGSTPLATLEKSAFSIGQTLELTSPTTIAYRLPMQQSEHLAAPIALSAAVEKLTIPLAKGELKWRESALALKMSADQLALKDALSLGPLTLTALSCSIESRPSKINDVQLTSAVAFAPNTDGAALLGSNGQLKLIAALDWRSNFAAEIAQLSLNSALCQAEMAGTVTDATFELSRPATLTCALVPAWVNRQLQQRGADLSLAKNASITATITAATIPLTKRSWKAKGVITSPTIALVATRSARPFALENVRCSFAGANAQSGHLEATITEKTAPAGTVAVTWETGQTHEWEIELTKCSTALVDALISGKNHWPAIVGTTFTLSATNALAEQQQTLDLAISSDSLTLNGAFIRSDTTLSSWKKPLKIQWTMTDRGFNALRALRKPSQSAPLFAVENSSRVTAQISDLSLPLTQPKGAIDWNLYQMAFDADFKINQLQLKSTTTDLTTTLDELDIELIKKGQGSKLSFELTGELSTPEGKTGTLQGVGSLDNALTPAGAFQPKDLSASIRTTLKGVPTLALDALIQLFFANATAPSLFLGKTVSASLDVAIDRDQGAIDLDLSATACKARFVGAVSQGLVSLKRPLQATLTITPELNAQLAQSASIEVTSLSEPITLYIDPNGFTVPLADLHLRSTQLKYGRLDFHRIVCRNRGSASDLSEIFKINPFQSSLISLWFAPMEFQITRGVMSIGRTEILYNQAYEVALWGNIDYHERYVSMMLGLTAQSLQAALNIRDLSPHYVLAIPISGPFGNVKLDKGAATSKIAFLIARKQIAPRAGAWGSLFGAIGDLADDQSNIPPAKPPFPWNN